jgi:hypothetical protein
MTRTAFRVAVNLALQRCNFLISNNNNEVSTATIYGHRFLRNDFYNYPLDHK